MGILFWRGRVSKAEFRRQFIRALRDPAMLDLLESIRPHYSERGVDLVIELSNHA